MILFNSPEGAAFRRMQPSRSALLAIWQTALESGEDAWIAWARGELASTAQDAELVALRFMQAASDGDERAMRQLWAVLGSFPPETASRPTVHAARELRRSLPF